MALEIRPNAIAQDQGPFIFPSVYIGPGPAPASGTGLTIGVITGTPPMVITSTTVVANLNVDLLDGSHAAAFIHHSIADAANDFLVASGDNAFARKTLAETGAILEADLDHGNIQGLGDDDHTQYVLHTDVDDVPVDGVTTDPISSNWAFDHVAAADPHAGYRLESANHNHQTSGAQAGTIDHGLALTGKGDDDHTQYLLASGARALAGNWNAGTSRTVTVGTLSALTAASGFLSFGSYDRLSANMTAAGFPFSASIGRTMTIRDWYQALFVATTNNGSHYWTIRLERLDGTILSSIATNALSPNVWYLRSDTAVDAVVNTGHISLFTRILKTGSPGGLYMHGPAVYAQ